MSLTSETTDDKRLAVLLRRCRPISPVLTVRTETDRPFTLGQETLIPEHAPFFLPQPSPGCVSLGFTQQFVTSRYRLPQLEGRLDEAPSMFSEADGVSIPHRSPRSSWRFPGRGGRTIFHTNTSKRDPNPTVQSIAQCGAVRQDS